MSYYTNIYPTGEKYSRDKYNSIEDVQKEYDEYQERLDFTWKSICGLIYSTPKELISKVTQEAENLLKFYKRCFELQYDVWVILSLWRDEEMYKKWEEDGDTSGKYRPSISRNHFEYNHDPEEGLQCTKEYIAKLESKLVGMACATPVDICPRADSEGNNWEPVEYLQNTLEGDREWYDDNLNDYNFCKLCVDFWDTHDEG